MTKSEMSTLLSRIEQQVIALQKQLQESPSGILQSIVLQSLGLIGVMDQVDLLAAYHPDRLVWALELSYAPAKKEWDFETTWNHQHDRALAWRYWQQCLIVKELYTDDQIELAQLILKEFGLQQNYIQTTKLAVKLEQILKIQEILNA